MAYRHKLNFNIPTGLRLPIQYLKTVNLISDGSAVGTVYQGNTVARQAPVVVYGVLPVFGEIGKTQSTREAAMVDTARMQFYAQIRSSNASLSAYTDADLMKAFMAVTGLHICAAALEKCFRVLGKWTFTNNAYRGVLIRSLWANPATILSNYATTVSRYNILRKRLESIPLMGDVPYLYDNVKVMQDVYADDMFEKSTVYTFMPSAIPYWNVQTTDPTYFLGNITYNTSFGGVPSANGSPSQPMKAEQLLDILETFLSIYNRDTDVNNICSEILKAFPNTKVSLPPIPEEVDKLYPWTPTFSINMNDAIRNATVYQVGAKSNPNIFPGIFEDINGKFNYCIAIDSSGNIQQMWNVMNLAKQDLDSTYRLGTVIQTDFIVRSAAADPDEAAIKDILQFSYNIEGNETGDTTAIANFCGHAKNMGTKIITGFTIYFNVDSAANDEVFYSQDIISTSGANVNKLFAGLTFKTLPHIDFLSNGILNSDSYCTPYRDMDYCTVVSFNELAQDHLIDMAEAFSVGQWLKR